MDKSNLPPASTAAALKALNKSSYKISKQSSSSSSSSSSMKAPSPPPPPLPSRLSPPLAASPPPPSSAPIDHPPPQPPVYNIDKSNFRDIVQKLTGSPSHLLPPQPPAAPAIAAAAPTPARPLMAPPPPPPPLTAIPSRLHRIRPPPLAPPRPPTILPAPAPAPAPGLSPLPALPSVCMSAESPISAYMRRLRGMPSPIHVPTSPLGFGCLHSPRAPTSPGVAMPATSPRVRDQ